MKRISRRDFLKGSASAATMMAMGLAAGGSLASASDENSLNINFDEDPYQATVMYWVANDARDVQHVEDALNELTETELNIHVNLQPVTAGTYASQIQLILASDDALDIFPFYGTNMATYVETEYIVDLSGMLETYGQNLIDIIGYEDISCGYLGDFLCGFPNMHERTNPVGIIMRTDILEEVGWSADDIVSIENLDDLFAAVHSAHPELTVLGERQGEMYPTQAMYAYCDQLTGAAGFGVLENSGQTTTVTNYFESEAFLDSCYKMRQWYLDGYIDADAATSTDALETQMKAGKIFSYITLVKPDTKEEKDEQTGYDTTVVYLTDEICTTVTTNGILMGISANSKDPEKAMILLDWIYSSYEANTLLNWGVEGVDWEYVADGVINYPEGVDSDSVSYHQDFGFAQFNQYNCAVWEGKDPDVWDLYQEARDAATLSQAYGFFFDDTEVINEYSALSSVFSQYVYALSSGTVDVDETAAAFNEAMYAAGLQTVIDAKQAQLDAWLAEQ
ncbi:MAG: extracellular solute-binding protein [Clostridiales bacterium]|nr:extracellular solute-binding protein [Clostridiales bacterium]